MFVVIPLRSEMDMPSKGASLADGRERLLTNRKDYLAAVDSAADAGKTADSRESLSCIGTPWYGKI